MRKDDWLLLNTEAPRHFLIQDWHLDVFHFLTLWRFASKTKYPMSTIISITAVLLIVDLSILYKQQFSTHILDQNYLCLKYMQLCVLSWLCCR